MLMKCDFYPKVKDCYLQDLQCYHWQGKKKRKMRGQFTRPMEMRFVQGEDEGLTQAESSTKDSKLLEYKSNGKHVCVTCFVATLKYLKEVT